MATQTTVTLVDDLDGSEADETITFAIDGIEYEIDLTDDHAGDLREAFAPFTDRARRTGGRRSNVFKNASSSPTQTRIELPDARPAWTAQERKSMQRFARANDLKAPADRGRISATIAEAWEEAGRPT